MRQVKTVILPLEKSALFDAKVNALLADGWSLKRREVLKMLSAPSEAFNVATYPALYAELTREVPPFPEEVTV